MFIGGGPQLTAAPIVYSGADRSRLRTASAGNVLLHLGIFDLRHHLSIVCINIPFAPWFSICICHSILSFILKIHLGVCLCILNKQQKLCIPIVPVYTFSLLTMLLRDLCRSHHSKSSQVWRGALSKGNRM